MSTKSNIYDVSLPRLTEHLQGLGLKKYAAGQIISWLYKKRVSSFAGMTNLSKEARKILAENFGCDLPQIDRVLSSGDGTNKYIFLLADGCKIESVDIPEKERRTVCLSTQVGCAMGCSICRTAEIGFKRNLTQGEIIGQLLAIYNVCNPSHAPLPITNVVLMGMGEPLANYDPVAGAIEIMLDERAVGLSHRRITLSTCGLIPELERFVKQFPVKVAISLSATTDEERDEIMPINKKYPLAKIMEFCRKYSKDFKHRITFEYVLIGGFNDSKEDAQRLLKLLCAVRAKVNIIPFNEFTDCKYKAPSRETIEFWSKFLFEKGIQTNIRVSRGREIMAACGQLGGR